MLGHVGYVQGTDGSDALVGVNLGGASAGFQGVKGLGGWWSPWWTAGRISDGKIWVYFLPYKLFTPLKMNGWNPILEGLVQMSIVDTNRVIFRFHVHFPGCNHRFFLRVNVVLLVIFQFYSAHVAWVSWKSCGWQCCFGKKVGSVKLPTTFQKIKDDDLVVSWVRPHHLLDGYWRRGVIPWFLDEMGHRKCTII